MIVPTIVHSDVDIDCGREDHGDGKRAVVRAGGSGGDGEQHHRQIDQDAHWCRAEQDGPRSRDIVTAKPINPMPSKST